MSRREELHEIFVNLLGSRNVYFQPPADIKMSYPCIKYERNRMAEKWSDNELYNNVAGYTVIVIDKDPDSTIPAKIHALPLCSFDRHYTVDQLNHDVYDIYY